MGCINYVNSTKWLTASLLTPPHTHPPHTLVWESLPQRHLSWNADALYLVKESSKLPLGRGVSTHHLDGEFITMRYFLWKVPFGIKPVKTRNL